MTLESSLCVMFRIWFCVLYSPVAIWFPCLCIMSCCVLYFDFPCPAVSFKYLLCSSLCLPLSVVLFLPCLPLIISHVGPPHLFLVLLVVSVYLVHGCVSIQGQHPLECVFEVQLRHKAMRSLSQFKVFSKCSPQMPPSFACFWRTHRYYPLWL